LALLLAWSLELAEALLRALFGPRLKIRRES
jgi:hypothetical protein